MPSSPLASRHRALVRAALGAAFLCASPAAAQIVYQNDFSGGLTTGFSATGGTPAIMSTPGDCSGLYCGAFLARGLVTGGVQPWDNQTVTLTLTGLGSHTSLTLGFSFYALSSWDGNTGGVGPDVFTVMGPSGTLLNSTFSNVPGYLQNYPAPGVGTASNPAQSGATEVNMMGASLSYYGSAVYDFRGAQAFTFAHTGSSATFTFTGSGLQGWGDEGWGLDNVIVSMAGGSPSSTVPEPATFGMLAAGIAALAFTRRARRAA